MNAVTSIEQSQKIHYAEVRRRLFGAGVKKPERLEITAEPVVDEPKRVIGPPPLWTKVPMCFDEHVVAYRIMLHLKALEASGEIEIVPIFKKSMQAIAQEVIAKFPGVRLSELRGVTRAKRVCWPRQIAMYETRRQRPDVSYPAIGRWYGGRDHTTVLHAERKVAAWMAAKAGEQS